MENTDNGVWVFDNEPDDATLQRLNNAIESSEGVTRTLPNSLDLLPILERPLFPGQLMSLTVNEDPWLATLTKIGKTPYKLLGLVLANGHTLNGISSEQFRAVGTLARIRKPTRRQGSIHFIAEGLERFEIDTWISRRQPFAAYVKSLVAATLAPQEVRAYSMTLMELVNALAALDPPYGEDLRVISKHAFSDPLRTIDAIANLITSDKDALQSLLEAPSQVARMDRVITLLRHELEVVRLQRDLRKRVESKVSQQERQFLLREQLKQIQQELGIHAGGRGQLQDRIRERLANIQLSEEAETRVEEEMEKLSSLEPNSPEYGVTRNYLDWMTTLPWGRVSEDRIDLEHAQVVLDRDHYGLDDVKTRIIESLALAKLQGDVSGSILLLVGPPGVGKTSIGRSVADALGREFYRLSLGGLHDEAEIKGHRRTYVGAMPGKFLQALKSAGVANPVIMLDELDKLGRSFRGDPASALLEILDPEQNSNFLDHYLDVRFDLSEVLFIGTANELDSIPAPLLDRMEVIRLPGYITEEKIAIAQAHIWPKLLAKARLDATQLQLSSSALERIIESYALEPGVRGLERRLQRVVRKAAVQIVKHPGRALAIDVKDLPDYLGQPQLPAEAPMSAIGVVSGLAWTAMGGATLNVEATRVHTRQAGLKLTGHLGGVMRESAEAAYSYVVANTESLGAKSAYFDNAFVHLHVPEGATPKDGPSAGITMAMAFLSLARAEPSRPSLAMTGELTLTGRVLAVGGIREKVMAARRNNIQTLLLPAANRGDFEALPANVKAGFKVHFVENLQQAAAVGFDQSPRVGRQAA